MTAHRKSNPRLEYHVKQRERIQASPSMGEKFPGLKALTVNLAYFDVEGITQKGEMKCKMNVQQAKSMLWFACPDHECFGGDFDLSDALAKAVAGRRKAMSGELRCLGNEKGPIARWCPAGSC